MTAFFAKSCVGGAIANLMVVAAIAVASGCGQQREAPKAQNTSTEPAKTVAAPSPVSSAQPRLAEKPTSSAEKAGTSDVKSASVEPKPAAAIDVTPVSPEEFKKVIATEQGHVVLVDFWATWCALCRAKFPATLALGKKYSGRGLVLVSMCMNDPDPKYRKEILEFLRQQDARIINLTNRMEDVDKVYEALKVDGGAVPHYQIYDRQGKLSAKFGGNVDKPFDEHDIETAVVAALNRK